MLIIGHISKLATNFAWIGVTLERVCFSRFSVGAWVSIDPKLLQKDESEQACSSEEVKVSAEVLRDEPFVDSRDDAERRSVADHAFKFAIVGDIHI